MFLNELTSVAADVLPLEEFRAHLRMGTAFNDTADTDDVLENCLRASLAAIEARIGRAILSRRYSWTLTRWQRSDQQRLPLSPVTEIESLSLVPDTGDPITVSPTSYRLSHDGTGYVISASGGALPNIPNNSDAEIIFTAGFAADWSGVPADLKQAVLILAATYFDYRHGERDRTESIPFGVMALIEPYRSLQLGGVG